jgi:Cu-Zn family superoxide dismutase
MRCAIVMLALSVAAPGSAHARAMAAQLPGGHGPDAAAEIQDATNRVLGRATFTALPGGSGVWVQVSVTGLPPGIHGIAVHEKGTCQGPDFASAGGHFNPRGRQHGLAHREGAHAGDLPNMVVNDAGTARYEAADVRLTLGEGPNSLFQPGGTALIIHARPDDQLTDPDGNAGPGIACGVIARPAS